MGFWVLYEGSRHHCSEVTTEAELNGESPSYGRGKTLYYLNGLDGGNYVPSVWITELTDSIELTDRNKTMEDFNDESTKFV